MDNLVRLSTKGIVLTWAVKGQGGHEHINTQNNDYVIAGPHRPAVDMAILAHCAYHVVSVGSFGWWGAFLGHGPAMYYRWQNMTHAASKGFVDANYYPSNWAIMD